MNNHLENRSWWNYIHEDLQELLKQSLLLVDIFEKGRLPDSPEGSPDSMANGKKFHDYAFIVFPAAKAYEGFLKTLFRDLGFITEEEFSGKRFRIGKALNPNLEKRFREESVYDKLVSFCQGKELPDALWDAWKSGRNLIFHWFPNERNVITFEEAKELVSKILSAIDFAFKDCKIDR
jgi:hypothetical protein